MPADQNQQITKIHDWFLPAIQAEGGVSDSFMAVRRELEYKQHFVACLERNLCQTRIKQPDKITSLRAKIKELQATLQFRLGMLSPDRPGAWFRQNQNQGTGPFASKTLSEPVLCQYDVRDIPKLKQTIKSSFEEGKLFQLPFYKTEPCLWLTLLSAKADWARINRLDPPFDYILLTELPQKLPQNLHSPALAAFLNKVRLAMDEVHESLQSCFDTLMKACDAFWEHQLQNPFQQSQSSQGPQRTHTKGFDFDQNSQDPFGTYRKTTRRGRYHHHQQQQIATASSEPLTKDVRALQFMNFQQFPDHKSLKKRFRELALRYHPDVPSGSEKQFNRLKTHYDHLVSRLKELGI